ncbi:dimethylargininase [Kitasatospora sp. NPDC051853]|uniref:dimethylargininase n=1 Tax=Kitasatospora sp. NPDC051853 TaxID=3364058 RepID=UPI0037BC18E1
MAAASSAVRTARRRHYLMCPPTHFTVRYAINPWMDPARPVDTSLAVRQWAALRDVLRALGHHVEEVPPEQGLPDMVFAANAATVVDDHALIATFRHPERAPESEAFHRWFREHGYRTSRARDLNEGEGDHLLTDDTILAAEGFRTSHRSHRETAERFGRPLVSLQLVDPRFYHLDTALAVLDDREIAYYPGAFSADSRSLLSRLFPTALLATEEDAAVLGLNAVCDGRNVVLPAAATTLAGRLAERGFTPVGVELGELLKGGGGPKCCTLELRHRAPTGSGGTVQAGRSGVAPGRPSAVRTASANDLRATNGALIQRSWR